jgi:NAD(P)H dehydrogenase (quinone)
MHVLTVLDHPDPNSFSAAAAKSFMAGAQSVGHSVELVDLNAEGFDPRWTMDDHQGRAGLPQEQERIERADAICLVFPLFWWGMPPTMKGWVDRVWSWGWAYDQLDDPEVSIQKKRPGVLLVPAGAKSETVEEKGYKQALETLWLGGTFGYFGFSPRRLELLCGSTGSDARRAALLEQSFRVGSELTSQ